MHNFSHAIFCVPDNHTLKFQGQDFKDQSLSDVYLLTFEALSKYEATFNSNSPTIEPIETKQIDSENPEVDFEIKTGGNYAVIWDHSKVFTVAYIDT
jgi:hypothetical protein